LAGAGWALAAFGRALARQCREPRCRAELCRAAERSHAVSTQLSLLARVAAVTAAAEPLVSNARNLLRAALHVLEAAEAACVTGLQQPPPGSEDAEVAAFCMQWRRKLLWHRAMESLNSDRDELGLRKTRARAEPTLTAMVQEQCPHIRNVP
ncbi:VINC protein, partial [Urocolius indicus]|nr:VINC protein [Urocolius indicus]